MRLDRKALRLLRMEDAVTLASVKQSLLEDPGVRRLKVKKQDITCNPAFNLLTGSMQLLCCIGSSCCRLQEGYAPSMSRRQNQNMADL